MAKTLAELEAELDALNKQLFDFNCNDNNYEKGFAYGGGFCRLQTYHSQAQRRYDALLAKKAKVVAKLEILDPSDE